MCGGSAATDRSVSTRAGIRPAAAASSRDGYGQRKERSRRSCRIEHWASHAPPAPLPGPGPERPVPVVCAVGSVGHISIAWVSGHSWRGEAGDSSPPSGFLRSPAAAAAATGPRRCRLHRARRRSAALPTSRRSHTTARRRTVTFDTPVAQGGQAPGQRGLLAGLQQHVPGGHRAGRLHRHRHARADGQLHLRRHRRARCRRSRRRSSWPSATA